MTIFRYDVPYVAPFALMLLLVGGVFIQHAVIGWRTGVVRFPMSIFSIEEFEKDQSAANFWGIMILDCIAALATMGASVHLLMLPWKLWN